MKTSCEIAQVNIGLGNGLVPSRVKSLPESMLLYGLSEI